MATRIAQRKLRNDNAEILNRVEDGESFVVTRNGVPVADVVPHTEHSRRPMFPKTRDVMARLTTGGPSLDCEAWLRDIRRADRGIDDDPRNSRA